MDLYFLILYFFTYGFLGWCTEVAYATTKQGEFVNRGFLNGPICPIYGVGVSVVVYFLTPFSGNLPFLYIASTVLVTVLEGLTGYFMDKIFHHKWWDYSNQPLNIGGYVCLIFSLVWGVACVIIVKGIHPAVHKALAFIPVPIGIAGIVVLGVVLSADLYVTASGILKLNRELEAMEKIAGELREISDKLGVTIHENVMGTMDIREEGKKKLEERVGGAQERIRARVGEAQERMEDVQARVEELRGRYEELSMRGTKVASRLVKAFPHMESRRHKDILEELKAKVKDRL